jgi:hypothetical protein
LNEIFRSSHLRHIGVSFEVEQDAKSHNAKTLSGISA